MCCIRIGECSNKRVPHVVEKEKKEEAAQEKRESSQEGAA